MNNLAETLSTQGNIQRARALNEQALDACSRVFGAEHPNTTVCAWNFFFMLNRLGDYAAAHTILMQYLVWLLSQDPTALTADQRMIQEKVARAVKQ